jgi:hypothetical protein
VLDIQAVAALDDRLDHGRGGAERAAQAGHRHLDRVLVGGHAPDKRQQRPLNLTPKSL